MKLLNEKDEISLKNRFISVRLVKEILEKVFTIRVVEERSDYIKFIIIRWARLYGFCFIWFQASLEIWINNENDKLIYEFFWPEYLALTIPFIMFIVIEEQIRDFILFFVFALVFFGFLMFLDTRWVSRKVRKAFESI